LDEAGYHIINILVRVVKDTEDEQSQREKDGRKTEIVKYQNRSNSSREKEI